MKAVIFLGPSLPRAEAENILPALYLPPAQQSDLISAVERHQPDVIGLIDGVFYQSLSVWHKEILYALDKGIQVYGASSMGALRAAETASFGMVGIGEVYRMYASGELIDDDEVALAHGAAADGYRKVSEAMVNIRATLAAAERAGIVDRAEHSQLIAIAKAMFFPHRTFPAMLEKAQSQGFPPTVAQSLSQFIATNYVDIKRGDAIELLTTIRNLGPEIRRTPGEKKPFQFHRTGLFETLYNRDRHVEKENISVPLEGIAHYAALHDPTFEDLNFNALNRAAVDTFAKVFAVESTDLEIEAELTRFRRKQDLLEEERFASWLAANDLSIPEFRQLMSQVANCRRMHRWLLTVRWAGRNTRMVLDELRLSGRYADCASGAAAQERLLENYEYEATNNSMESLIREQERWTECKMSTDWRTWAEEAGFHDASELKLALAREKAARQALTDLLGPAPADTLRSDSPA